MHLWFWDMAVVFKSGLVLVREAGGQGTASQGLSLTLQMFFRNCRVDSWSFQFRSDEASDASWCLSLCRGYNAGLLQIKLAGTKQHRDFASSVKYQELICFSLPPHHRKKLISKTSAHSSLGRQTLYSLCKTKGGGWSFPLPVGWQTKRFGLL